ncbi:hypothetical protein PM082_001169 [Marasmius tenuissimus]|nr:hypothetical protein PM082_001169 [Marasmius tenuissimus]
MENPTPHQQTEVSEEKELEIVADGVGRGSRKTFGYFGCCDGCQLRRLSTHVTSQKGKRSVPALDVAQMKVQMKVQALLRLPRAPEGANCLGTFFLSMEWNITASIGHEVCVPEPNMSMSDGGTEEPSSWPELSQA